LSAVSTRSQTEMNPSPPVSDDEDEAPIVTSGRGLRGRTDDARDVAEAPSHH
jgi:hypothetical protein